MVGKTWYDGGMKNLDSMFGYPSLDASLKDCSYNSQTEALARLLCRQNLLLCGPVGSGKEQVLDAFFDTLSAVSATAHPIVFNRGRFEVAYDKDFRPSLNAVFHLIFRLAGLSDFTLQHECIATNDLPTWDKVLEGLRDISEMVDCQDLEESSTLIVENIQTLTPEFLNNLDVIFQWVKNNNKPFGGMQVVFVGDFLQVVQPERGQDATYKMDYPTEVLKARSYKKVAPICLYLDKLADGYDPKMHLLLSAIAQGTIRDPDVYELILQCVNQGLKVEDDSEYVGICATNEEKQAYNRKFFNRIASDGGGFDYVVDKDYITENKDGTSGFNISQITDVLPPAEPLAPKEKASLKQGAKVVLTKDVFAVPYPLSGKRDTLPVKLPQGERYEVVGLDCDKYESGLRISDGVRLKDLTGRGETFYTERARDCDLPEVSYSFPATLGFGLTANETLGKTFDKVVVDLGACQHYCAGLGYTMISRAKSLSTLAIKGFHEKALEVDPQRVKAVEDIKTLALKSRESALGVEHDELSQVLTNVLLVEFYWQ